MTVQTPSWCRDGWLLRRMCFCLTLMVEPTYDVRASWLVYTGCGLCTPASPRPSPLKPLCSPFLFGPEMLRAAHVATRTAHTINALFPHPGSDVLDSRLTNVDVHARVKTAQYYMCHVLLQGSHTKSAYCGSAN